MQCPCVHQCAGPASRPPSDVGPVISILCVYILYTLTFTFFLGNF